MKVACPLCQGKGEIESTSPLMVEVDAPAIEITPAMIEVGAKEFCRWSGGAPMDIGNESTAAECIFRAMWSAAR